MSDENGSPDTGDLPDGGAGPRPEPLRFFGTTWVNHDDGYTARRIAVAAGSLVVTVAACFVLRFAYEGLAIAAIGRFVTVLLVVMFAGCSALAFGHTWDGFRKRPDPARVSSLRGLLTIGFLGSLVAYTFRAFHEAPGEHLHREEYEAARERHERRAVRRTGNPAKRRRKG
ncbi:MULTISPECIES: EamA/RhaT family transporter [unclassified Streptomyces]|uniref:EamA/RhaT family transporter n=1 Tax=unclassified Streptomyces TaxID=2593676 RepID=UPI000DD5E0B5|nr:MULTISPECIES: EamA/RhaT family transporter [unclassified Streptomyces]QZZ29417.1 EamA/RhaT family transporter [Streptomyces sp. ST1015]